MEKAGWEALQANRIAWINTKIAGFPWLCIKGRGKRDIKEFLKDKIYSFNKYLLSTSNIIGNVLNARDLAVNQAKSSPLGGISKICISP